MDSHIFRHCVHTDKFGRIIKEGARAKKGAEARMIEKRLNKEGGGIRGEKKQRDW